MKKFTVNESANLKNFTDNVYPQGSFCFSRLLRDRDIRVNGKRTGRDMPLSVGDEVAYYTTPREENLPCYERVYEDENIQTYLDDQSAVPCKKGNFELPSMLDGMKPYIQNDKMADYQDHHYPAEMSVDAMIQTLLVDESDNAIDTFLQRFDTEWARYNRDLIAKVQKFYEEHPEKLTEGGN